MKSFCISFALAFPVHRALGAMAFAHGRCGGPEALEGKFDE